MKEVRKGAMRKSGERACQAHRTASAKALDRSMRSTSKEQSGGQCAYDRVSKE